MTKEINLTRGKSMLVDDEDFEWANQWKWSTNKNKNKNCFYAVRYNFFSKKSISFHRSIMGNPIGMQIHHKDGNGLNNQKDNLEIISRRNHSYTFNRGETSSKYPGVDWYKRSKKWRSIIRINKIKKHLGYFTDEKEAAEAYVKACKELLE